MKIKRYIWVVEWLAVILLLALAIFSVIKEEIYLYIFGLLFIIFGLFRIIPLVKTTDSKFMKISLAIETSLDVLAGVFILLSSIYNWNFIKDTSLLGIIIGCVIYLRGFVYFLGTTLKNEPSDIIGFLMHIIFLTISTYIIAKGGFDNKYLSWLLFIVILIICIIFSIKGYKDFKNYRGLLVGENQIKKINIKNKDKEKNKGNDIDNIIIDPISPESEDIYNANK